MTYLFSTYWPWMLLALVLGGIVGFTSFLRSGRGLQPNSWPGWFKLLGLLFVVGLIVAVLKLLPGLLGHYLETALLFVGSYIVGCFLGSWLASFRSTEPEVSEQPQVQVTRPTTAGTAAPVAAATAAAAAVVAPALKPVSTPTPAPVPAPAPAPAPAKPVTAAAPATPPPVAASSHDGGHPGQRPSGISRVGVTPDSLQRISGIGHVNEEKLNELGIWTFKQIAAWTHANAEWVGSYMAFPGRIEREDWIGQAAQLAQGRETDFSRRVEHGDVPTSSIHDTSKPIPVATPAPAAPAPAAASASDGGHPGQRPPSAAKGSVVADNLKRISGIGHVNEEKLNELGIWTFKQIAAWTHLNTEWVGSYMAFPGRIEREDWVGQASKLAQGIETEFSRRVDHGDVPTSQ
jgi:predicted flap endonuclease-1-like 5' DNA nuclease